MVQPCNIGDRLNLAGLTEVLVPLAILRMCCSPGLIQCNSSSCKKDARTVSPFITIELAYRLPFTTLNPCTDYWRRIKCFVGEEAKSWRSASFHFAISD